MCEWRRGFKSKFDVILHYIFLVSAKVFLSLLLGEVFILFHIFYLSYIFILICTKETFYGFHMVSYLRLFFVLFCFYTVWLNYCHHHCLSLPGCTKISPETENKVWLVGILQWKLCLTLGRDVGHDKRWTTCITNKPLFFFFQTYIKPGLWIDGVNHLKASECLICCVNQIKFRHRSHTCTSCFHLGAARFNHRVIYWWPRSSSRQINLRALPRFKRRLRRTLRAR